MVDGVAVNGQVSRISGLNTQRNLALLAARSDFCVAGAKVTLVVSIDYLVQPIQVLREAGASRPFAAEGS